jgi:5-oxoprolinase (ATP-hydrolysing) subunit A
VRTIDINADVGEGGGLDVALMRFISSASVAAGFHAGSLEILRNTVQLAKVHGVAVGVHPGFRDRESFGRAELPITPLQAQALVSEQIEIVAAAAAAEGIPVQHVKPHGALYNMAARDRGLADALVNAVRRADSSLILFAPPDSQLFASGVAAGLRVAREVFADRAYAPDGSLVPRTAAGAVIHDVDLAAARGLRMAAEGTVVATDGSVVQLAADTICVHGDTPGCDTLAEALRSALEHAGIDVRSIGRQPRCRERAPRTGSAT